MASGATTGLAPLDVTLDTTGTGCYNDNGQFHAAAGTIDFGDGTTGPGGSAVLHTYAAGEYLPTVSVDCLGNVDQEGGPDVVALEPAQISVKPNSLDAGDVQVGSQAGPYAITITNTGGVDYVMGGAATNTVEFSIAQNTCTDRTPSPGDSCEIDLVFGPSALGERTGQLQFLDNTAVGFMAVDLTGTGVDDFRGTPSPGSLDFGSQPVGTTTPFQTVTFTNDGGSPIPVTAVVRTGSTGFKLGPITGCTAALVPVGGSCKVKVRFQPGVEGPQSGTLQFVSGALDSPDTVSLTGTGTPRTDIAVSIGAPGAAGPTDQITYEITVQNAGPSIAYNVDLVDTLPAVSRLVSFVKPAGPACDKPAVGHTGTVHCRIAQLVRNGSRSFKVTVQLSALLGSTITDVGVGVDDQSGGGVREQHRDGGDACELIEQGVGRRDLPGVPHCCIVDHKQSGRLTARVAAARRSCRPPSGSGRWYRPRPTSAWCRARAAPYRGPCPGRAIDASRRRCPAPR